MLCTSVAAAAAKGVSPGPAALPHVDASALSTTEKLPRETYFGHVENTNDGLLLFEAVRQGLATQVTHRLTEAERESIRSGSCFVYQESRHIRRWTDGRLWSPSRINGNFLVYREIDQKIAVDKKDARQIERDLCAGKEILDSLKGVYYMKPNGLMKKTMSVKIGGVPHHLICYYRMSDKDTLPRPSSCSRLHSLDIDNDLIYDQAWRRPIMVDTGGPDVPQQQEQLSLLAQQPSSCESLPAAPPSPAQQEPDQKPCLPTKRNLLRSQQPLLISPVSFETFSQQQQHKRPEPASASVTLPVDSVLSSPVSALLSPVADKQYPTPLMSMQASMSAFYAPYSAPPTMTCFPEFAGGSERTMPAENMLPLGTPLKRKSFSSPTPPIMPATDLFPSSASASMDTLAPLCKKPFNASYPPFPAPPPVTASKAADPLALNYLSFMLLGNTAGGAVQHDAKMPMQYYPSPTVDNFNTPQLSTLTPASTPLSRSMSFASTASAEEHPVFVLTPSASTMQDSTTALPPLLPSTSAELAQYLAIANMHLPTAASTRNTTGTASHGINPANLCSPTWLTPNTPTTPISSTSNYSFFSPPSPLAPATKSFTSCLSSALLPPATGQATTYSPGLGITTTQHHFPPYTQQTLFPQMS